MSGARLLLHGVLGAILLLGMASILASFNDLLFAVEGFIFIVLLITLFFGLRNIGSRCSQLSLFWFYLIVVANFVVLAVVYNTSYVVLLILGIIGFFLSIPKRVEKKPVETTYDEPHSMVFDTPAETKKEIAKRFVASSSSSLYHNRSCEWGKKIRKERKLFFSDKEAAWEQGYRAHSCINE